MTSYNSTADERARMLNVPYALRQHLALHRTGAVDMDKEARLRATADRRNAKKRAKTADTYAGQSVGRKSAN